MKPATRHLRLVSNEEGRRPTNELPPRAPRFVVGSTGSLRLPDVDERELVRMALNDDRLAIELLMRRHIQRLFRVVRSVLTDVSEVEDVLQLAYLQAFAHLHQYDGAVRWSTWAGRLALSAGLTRLLRPLRHAVSGASLPPEIAQDAARSNPTVRAHDVPQAEASTRLERAIDRMPELDRAVLILHDVEGMSTIETAELLGIGAALVQKRLRRSRSELRLAIEILNGGELHSSFDCGFERCDRIVTAVLTALRR